MTSFRTRFAPSPTGQLHVGGARTAILNWLLARQRGGQFVVRVEDTDTERNVPGAEAAMLDDLRWLGLDWDEGPDVGGEHGPYRQSERTGIYRDHADRLLASGSAYHCHCPPAAEASGDHRPRCACADRTAPKGPPAEASIRLRTPDVGEITVDDLVRGTIAFPASSVEDFVLVRSDGRPTYNFAAAVDDARMGITHVIRGADHIANTPKQILLYQAFGIEAPRFGHIPLILGPDRQKLSKRHGATSVAEHRRLGYLPEAMVNYLSLLSWSSPTGEEFLPVERLIEEIGWERMGSSDAVFDRDKLRWLSSRYVQALPLAELVARAAPFVDAAPLPIPEDRRAGVVSALRERVSVLSEIPEQLALLSGPRTEEQWRAAGVARREEEARHVLDAVADRLQRVELWEETELHAALRGVSQELGVRGRAFFGPVRAALTGEEHGPDLAKVLLVLGAARSRELLLGRAGPSFDGAHDAA